jgi:hypothetical protein
MNKNQRPWIAAVVTATVAACAVEAENRHETTGPRAAELGVES